jgi:hypothetical protein
MPKYIFSQGTVRVQPGVYDPKRDRRLSGFGVLILIPPQQQETTLTESTQVQGQSTDDHTSADTAS